MDEIVTTMSPTEVDRVSYREYKRNRIDAFKEAPFCDFFEFFVFTEKHGNVRPRTEQTLYTRANAIRKIAPELTMADLDDNKDAVQWLLDKYGETHRRNTVLDFKNSIYNALRYAESEHVIEKFNNYNVKIHSVEDNMTYAEQASLKNVKKTLSRSEFDKMNTQLLQEITKGVSMKPDDKGYIKMFKGNRYNLSGHVLIFLLMHTGLRYSEALGVKKSDITPGKLNIERSWNYKDKPGHFDFTKNTSSIRSVVISDTVYMILIQFITWFEQNYGDVGDDPIFVKKGDIADNSTNNNRLKALMKRSGIEETVTIHKLRHTYISILLDRGISPETIAKQVGHADTSMINKVYGHLLEERRNEEIIKIKTIM